MTKDSEISYEKYKFYKDILASNQKNDAIKIVIHSIEYHHPSYVTRYNEEKVT